MKKTLLIAIAVIALQSTASASVLISYFARTPRCCNGAAIRTEMYNNQQTNRLGSQFEYFRLKNNGDCQHVKQTTGQVHTPGYVHITQEDGGFAAANQWFTNTIAECCGTPPGSYAYWDRNCSFQWFVGQEP